jgi:hypothetical protein
VTLSFVGLVLGSAIKETLWLLHVARQGWLARRTAARPSAARAIAIVRGPTASSPAARRLRHRLTQYPTSRGQATLPYSYKPGQLQRVAGRR